MKIQPKILIMALGPLAAMGIIICVLSNVRVSSVLTDSIKNGLRAAAISVRDTLTYADEGEYALDRNGNLCKGDFNITRHTDIADDVKNATDMDITVFYGDTRYMTSIIGDGGNRMVGTKAGDEVVQKVLRGGQEFFSTNVDVYGQKYFGYYVPLYATDGKTIVGMVFSGMPQAEAKSQIMQIIMLVVGISIAVGVIAAILVVMMVSKIVVALRKGADTLEHLSQGRLDLAKLDERYYARKDEIGTIARAIGKLEQELTSIIGTIKSQGEELNTSAAYLSNKVQETSVSISQVEKAVGEVAEGATNQAGETQSATDNVIHIGDMVEETAREAETMFQSAQSMQERGKEAFETLHELHRINDQARESIDVIYEQTNTTNQSAQKIKEATNLITSIAEETNLLSLNASIEAARAGEQGRGFAVVASQIQKLAEQSNESAKQIEDIISELIADSDKSVETMNVVKEIMETQSENVRKTDARFSEVLKGIEESITAINRITGKMEEMDQAKISVVDTVQGLTAIAEQNAASTQETSASLTEITNVVSDISDKSEALKDIAVKLEESMRIFKL